MPASVKPEARARRRNGAAKPKCRRRLWRPIIDIVISGLAFVLVSTMFVAPVSAGTSPAAFAGIQLAVSPAGVKALAEQGPLPIVAIATASSPAEAVYRQTSQSAAWGLLGVAFSLMAALNLAFLRHLRRTYAPNLAVSTCRDRVCG